ncbi:MAG: sugar phosphate isomerase/epimerase family protein, partial [bacterium]
MKLSFSIKYWYETGWDIFRTAALDAKLQGIELYDINRPIFQGRSSPVSPEMIGKTRRSLINQGLKIPCIDTEGDFTDPGFERELNKCVDAAVELGVEYIGIHTRTKSQPACTQHVAKLLAAIGDKPVTLLIETTGTYADTSELRALLNHFADDRLAATWDMYATSLIAGEDAETTITNLGAYVRHVHIHDYRRKEDGGIEPELIGEGDLPLKELMDALRSVNYAGFISLQWGKYWISELSDLEIILTHFVTRMGHFESTRIDRKQLYWNNAHTGTFPWKKETLIEKTFPQVLDTMVEEYP